MHMNRSDKQEPDIRNLEFVRLLAKHELRLAGYVHALVPAWHDAEDILQNTKLRLWTQFDSYRPDEDFAGWSFTIAGYLVKEYHKRCQRQRVHFSDELLEKISQRFATPSTWDARTSALVECVKTLNTASRKLLRLFCTERRKLKEIAVDLGQTPSATYQAMSRIRRGLLVCIRNRLREGKE
jgi:RNA polymerase sigma-70 factor (ECF subfamily)